MLRLLSFQSIQLELLFCGQFRDGPLENLWGVGGGGEVQKRIFAQGKIKRKKIHARQLTLRNIHAMA